MARKKKAGKRPRRPKSPESKKARVTPLVSPPPPPLGGPSGFGVDSPDGSDVGGRRNPEPGSKIDGGAREPQFGSPAYFGINIPSPKLPDLDSILPRKISAVEWVGLVGLFVSLAAGFFLGALAAAGIINMGLAQVMLLAALIVLTIGSFAVERLARRSWKRIFISTISTGVITSVVLFGVVNPWMVRKKQEQNEREQAQPPATTKLTTNVDPGQSLDVLRNELRNDSSKPIRDVGFSLKLNRKYSLEELGHFRIIYEIFDKQNRLDFFVACQSLYQVNRFFDRNAKAYGTRCTVEYRTSEKGNTFATIPLIGKQKYSGLLSSDYSVGEIEWSVDLYNQIPSYKTLEDFNRKDLYIFVTAPLADKISELSFKVNYWELISAKAEILKMAEDRPIAPWIMPLTTDEKSTTWRGVYLKDLQGIAKTLPPDRRETVVVWSLDFASVHPKKLPEPEIKYDPLNPPKAN